MELFEEIEEELSGRRPGWWERIVERIPELAALAGTEQPSEHHAEGDVARHTQQAVSACPRECDPDLLWAALLHDIGKPSVTHHGKNRITAHGHHTVGARMADNILDRIGMPRKRGRRIVWAVQNHLFHLSWNLTATEQASPRHRNVIADPRFPLLLELLRVDSAASGGNPRGMDAYNLYKCLFKEITNSGHRENS